MLVQVHVQGLGLDPATNTPVVLLQEVAGERVLPIWIGGSEASAIAVRLAEMRFPRPLTHDLLAAVIGTLGGRLSRVVVRRGDGNLYFAEMVFQRGDEEISLDARPSDAIAVALRAEAEIHVPDDLLGTARPAGMTTLLDPNKPAAELQEHLKEELARNPFLRPG